MTDFQHLLERLVRGGVGVFGLKVRVVDLETLIRLKRAAGRPKDLERIAELEGILARSLKAP